MPNVVLTEALELEVTRGLKQSQLFKDNKALEKVLRKAVSDAKAHRQRCKELAREQAKIAGEKDGISKVVEKARKSIPLDSERSSKVVGTTEITKDTDSTKGTKTVNGTNGSVDVGQSSASGPGGLSDSLKDLLQTNTSGKKAPALKEKTNPDNVRESKDVDQPTTAIVQTDDHNTAIAMAPVTIPFASVKEYWELARAAGQYNGPLYKLLDGSEIYETPYTPPKKCPELVHRLKRLEIMSQEAEYRRMTRNVDTSRIRKDAQQDARELKGVKQQFFMVINVVLSAGGVYLAAYYALYNQLSYGPRVGAATLAMVVAVVAEIWLFLKGDIFYNTFEKPSHDRQEKKRVDTMVSNALSGPERGIVKRPSAKESELAKESKKKS